MRVFVVGDGMYDVGECRNQVIDGPDLPALPEIIQKLLPRSKDVQFVCSTIKEIRTRQSGGAGPLNKKKVIAAVLQASRHKADAVVFVIDRDGDRQRMQELNAGRREISPQDFLPIALGMAVETFDAWMIADAGALRHVEGCERAEAHPSPESLDGGRGTQQHPKDYAIRQVGADRLWDKYACIAKFIDIAHLERVCPQGFQPFANEVRSNLRYD